MARADDAPPYFTILITGHIVVPLMFVVDRASGSMQVTQAVTRAFHETFFDFHPQITHDLHESLLPRAFIASL